MSALINAAEAAARRKLLDTTRAELPDLAAVREFVERVSDQA